MTFSIIQKSQLEGADRIDAEYYQPEYLLISELLRRQKTQILKNLSNFIKKGIFDLSPDNYRSSGIPFIRTTSIKDPLLDLEEIVFLEAGTHQKNHSTSLQSGDLVFTKIGANIGDLSLLPSDFYEYNFSQNVAGVSVNKKAINFHYLFTYLLSKYGRKQIERRQMISGQGKLELEDLRNLQIVIPSLVFEREIESLIVESQRTKQLSIELYQNAEHLLLEKLGLKDFQTPQDLSYIVNYSDTKKVERVDADYFQPKYEFLVNKLGKKKELFKFADRINTSFKIEPDKEYNYIEIGDVNVGTGEVVFNKVVGKELPANAKIKICGGELIISKVRPTRGAIAIIPDEFNKDFVVSGAFSVFNLASPAKEFLQVVLRSLIGKLQMERPTTGTSYPTITDQDMENLWIPSVKVETQQKIADLVRKSHGARKKSKELLEEAKRKVEEMIEKGGD